MTHPHSYHRIALLVFIAASHCHFGTAAALEAAIAAGDEEEEAPSYIEPESESLIATQFTTDPYAHRDRMEMILNGEFVLADVLYSPNSFRQNGAAVYADDVRGEFCAYDAALDRTDPAAYPTASAAMSLSEHCGEHRYQLPLRDVVRAVRAHDAGHASAPRTLPVAGLLFHEGYVGAGLLANALATFKSTRVVAEHAALGDALAACDVIRNRYKSEDCDPAQQRRLVGDVVALLARTSADAGVRHLYLKLPSASLAYLPELRALYPAAPWAFVYRAADAALAKAMARPGAACVKTRRNPSSAFAARADEHVRQQRFGHVEDLTKHEVCAVHLSALLGVARQEHETTGTGMLVSYEHDIRANAEYVVGSILPYLGLEEEIHADPGGVRDRVAAVLSTKSNTNGGGDAQNQQWKGESVDVSEEVAAASKAYMSGDMDSIMHMREGGL